LSCLFLVKVDMGHLLNLINLERREAMSRRC